MCGRYFIDGDSEAEITRLILNGGHPLRRRQGGMQSFERISSEREVDARPSDRTSWRRKDCSASDQMSWSRGDVYPSEQASWGHEASGMSEQPHRSRGDVKPSESAPVLVRSEEGLAAADMRWGFISPKGKGLLINARSETALQKPSFSESVLHRRCIIPAAGFYEWDKSKTQYSFFLPDRPVIFMAGCFRRYEDGDRFTILTTAANESMSQIHDRMPLILPERDIDDWLYEDGRTAEFLRQGSALLSKRLTHPETVVYEQLTLPGIF